jgi:hypothetical protein
VKAAASSRSVRVLATVLLALLLEGCGLTWAPIDFQAVQGARRGLDDYETFPPLKDEDPYIEKPAPRSVFLAELIAIFPGFFVHGLGHYYAGDYRTWRKLSHIGQFGYLLSAMGGGLLVGGYYLDKEDEDSYAYSLYGAGGVVSVVGVSYLLTGWIYDIADTPRAVRSGGLPPPRTPLLDSMDIFE